MKSIGRDQEKNRAEIILEESGKLSVEEQECVLATLRGNGVYKRLYIEEWCG